MSAEEGDVVQFIMPMESQAREIRDGYFQEGETVVYHSRTHSGFLRTRIAKIHTVGGVVQSIDLVCKRSADLTKIAKIQDAGIAQDDAADNVPRKHRGNVLTELPSPLHVENAERKMAVGGDGILCEPPPATTVKTQKAATEVCGAVQESPAPRFGVGEKVFYYSKTHGATVIAKVEGITADGLYDLDIKKSAQPCNVSAYVEEDPAPPCLAAAGEQAPLFFEDASARQPTRVMLPLQKVYTGIDCMPATDCSVATPMGFGVPCTTPHGYTKYGEGHLVSCKISAAVPIGPRPPSPSSNRTGPPATFFSGGGVTPKAATPQTPAQTPAQAAAGAELAARLRGELRVNGAFDPQRPEVRAQLAGQLSLEASARIKEMSGFKGGMNQGIWLVSGSQELVLKQVRCVRVASNVLTEAENFVRIVKEHPEIASDPLVAFPVKLFSCIGPEGKPISDIIVMKKSRGERLCEYVATKFYAKQERQLCVAMEQVGRALRRFHQRYGSQQHGDFQPSNIYYDERSNTVSFIDVGGMGVPTTGNDVDHLHQCMRSMTIGYKPTLHIDLLQAFDKGYQCSPSSSQPQQQQGFFIS